MGNITSETREELEGHLELLQYNCLFLCTVNGTEWNVEEVRKLRCVCKMLYGMVKPFLRRVRPIPTFATGADFYRLPSGATAVMIEDAQLMTAFNQLQPLPGFTRRVPRPPPMQYMFLSPLRLTLAHFLPLRAVHRFELMTSDIFKLALVRSCAEAKAHYIQQNRSANGDQAVEWLVVFGIYLMLRRLDGVPDPANPAEAVLKSAAMASLPPCSVAWHPSVLTAAMRNGAPLRYVEVLNGCLPTPHGRDAAWARGLTLTGVERLHENAGWLLTTAWLLLPAPFGPAALLVAFLPLARDAAIAVYLRDIYQLWEKNGKLTVAVPEPTDAHLTLAELVTLASALRDLCLINAEFADTTLTVLSALGATITNTCDTNVPLDHIERFTDLLTSLVTGGDHAAASPLARLTQLLANEVCPTFGTLLINGARVYTAELPGLLNLIVGLRSRTSVPSLAYIRASVVELFLAAISDAGRTIDAAMYEQMVRAVMAQGNDGDLELIRPLINVRVGFTGYHLHGDLMGLVSTLPGVNPATLRRLGSGVLNASRPVAFDHTVFYEQTDAQMCGFIAGTIRNCIAIRILDTTVMQQLKCFVAELHASVAAAAHGDDPSGYARALAYAKAIVPAMQQAPKGGWLHVPESGDLLVLWSCLTSDSVLYATREALNALDNFSLLTVACVALIRHNATMLDAIASMPQAKQVFAGTWEMLRCLMEAEQTAVRCSGELNVVRACGAALRECFSSNKSAIRATIGSSTSLRVAALTFGVLKLDLADTHEFNPLLYTSADWGFLQQGHCEWEAAHTTVEADDADEGATMSVTQSAGQTMSTEASQVAEGDAGDGEPEVEYEYEYESDCDDGME